MKHNMKKPRFKKKETGYHESAVKILALWVDGIIEKEFYIDSVIAFVPDVTCYKDGVLSSIYEVVYSHPVIGKKLGLIQAWCYFNSTELSVFEVSADWILKQTEKPKRIETMEYYNIELL